MAAGNVRQAYENVITHFDDLLAQHGYVRQGRLYRAVRPNNDTLVFFCHFALECVLLSRLLNASSMVLWHGLCAAPSSVTTVVTEERRPASPVSGCCNSGMCPISWPTANSLPSWPASVSAMAMRARSPTTTTDCTAAKNRRARKL